MTDSIRNPAASMPSRSIHPSPAYERLALEAETIKEAGYLHNVGGVDRPLYDYPLGWGESGIIGVQDVEQRR